MGGAAIEGLGGLIGVVLAILGLANVYPGYMQAVAAIAIGAGFVFEGSAFAARYSRILRAAGGDRSEQVEVGGGTTAELLGGIAGIVLGILALLAISGSTLMAASAIVFGATLVAGAGTTARLNAFHVRHSSHPQAQEIADESVKASAGGQGLAGLAAVVLGILALVHQTGTSTFALIAFLVVGATQILSGSTIAGKMAGVQEAST